MNKVKENDYIVTISDSGKGKRSPLEDFTLQNRNGKGLKTCGSSIHQMAGNIACKIYEYILLVTNNEGLYPVSVADITETNRTGNMYRIFDLDKDEKIITVYKLPVYNEEDK